MSYEMSDNSVALPKAWSNPIFVWWAAAAAACVAIILLRNPFVDAVNKPWPLLTFRLPSGESVRILKDDADVMVSLSWHFRSGTLLADGGIGATSYDTVLKREEFHVARLDPSTIIIVDLERDQLLAAIHATPDVVVGIDPTENRQEFIKVASAASQALGRPITPLLGRVVREYRGAK
ncbi:MAG: hypothetical protein K2Y21_12630 [Phycisphaerales bacterium]|nr:hypothetical protein [Phycisphaerales bacterium]